MRLVIEAVHEAHKTMFMSGRPGGVFAASGPTQVMQGLVDEIRRGERPLNSVTEVLGTVRADLGLRDVLAALFPCGSVTGAPKRMAVSRTRLVEPWRRGVYCGAIGVIAPGLVDLSVAIRTAVLHDGWAWYGTGGGIVADSDPDEEWEEAMTKARAFFTATGTAPPGG